MSYVDDFQLNIKLLKFISQYPFYEVILKDSEDRWTTQIVMVNFASQEVTLRDFCEYEMNEVLGFEFEDPEIQKKWIELKNELLP